MMWLAVFGNDCIGCGLPRWWPSWLYPYGSLVPSIRIDELWMAMPAISLVATALLTIAWRKLRRRRHDANAMEGAYASIAEAILAMNEKVENLVLEQLRAIRSDIAKLGDDIREGRARASSFAAWSMKATWPRRVPIL